jgi:hypothetical protein
VWGLDSRIEWLVEGMIPRSSVNLISAESGTGKTWLAHAIAGAVARGPGGFIGRTVDRATPVLYLDGENPLYVVKRNLAHLGIGETDNLRVWGGWNEEPPPGPDDPRITRFAGAEKPLLIWDSLVEFADCDEQSSTEMRDFMKKFRSLAHLGATVIVLHHTGKSKSSQEYRGSSDIKASVDMAYVLTGQPRHGKLHRLAMAPFKSRIAPGEKFAMQFREGQGFDGISVPQPALCEDPADVLRRIVREHPNSNGTQIKTLAKDFGIGKNRVEQLLGTGEYNIQSGKGAALLYSLWDDRVPDFPDPEVQEIGKSEEGAS